MANIYLRSPKYIAATAPTNAVKVQLELVVDSSSIYTLEKTTSAGSSVLFEVSELFRDYLDLSVDTDSTHSVPYYYTLTFLNSYDLPLSTLSDGGFMNDGYTYFEDGKKIKSVENRLTKFDNITYHSGTTCTDNNKRVVININYEV